VHATPRRKIIRAKRPPMSKTSTPHSSVAAVISNKTAAIVVTPPTSAEDSNKRERSWRQNSLESLGAPATSTKDREYDVQHKEYVFMGKEKEKVPEGVVMVQIDSSVREVSFDAFSGRDKLKKVIMNEGLLRINRSFANCVSLEEVIMPSTVLTIDETAFSNCYQLKEVELNEGLMKLGDWTFGGCSSLERVDIPSTLKRVGGYTFSGCVSLKEVSFGAGLESIGFSAFAGCRLLRQVVFNDGLKEIGNDAFWNCSNLTKVIMNEKNIQRIHCNAFQGCSLLRKIILQSLSSRLSTIVKAGNTQVEGKLNSILGFYLGCKDEQIYLNAQAYASGGAGQPDLNLWKQIKENYLGRIDDMLSFYERKEATIIFELAWWKNKIDNPEEDSSTTREECKTDIPGPAKDTIWQYLSCASSFDDGEPETHAVEPDWDNDDATVSSQATIPLEGLEDHFHI